MRRSFVRLVVSSVLVCWAVGLVVMSLYARRQTWTEDEVRRDGVFLLFDMLDETQAADRAQRVQELQSHTSIGLAVWCGRLLRDRADVSTPVLSG